MSLLSIAKDLPSFIDIFTELFDDLNLIEMLYNYYYIQWDIIHRGLLGSVFNIVRNSIVLSEQDLQHVNSLEHNKYYLIYTRRKFVFVKITKGGYKFYKSSSVHKNFSMYEIKNDHQNQWKFYEIPVDFYPIVSEELNKLDNSRCLLL